ncbi:SNF2-related protein [Desulfocurvus vexinensis]|uniref:SNF2-related protein n=1 Tax=Desulfocurvus vexinensis TaxID=399548 RepID=UPI0004AD917E|nr:SNF2-related protein [Desulfocurvus vexinensis]
MGCTEQNGIPFSKGQLVVDKNNPSQQGIYTGRCTRAGSQIMVEVQYPNGNTGFRPLGVLEALEPDKVKTLREQFFDGRFGKLSDLKRLITYEKLKGTLHEVIYSMEAAQIDFYPYQFKPVLKFINSPTERLILADEVGLGKTIESGLIWMEMQARYQSNRLLVICPKILAEKWHEELRNKFLLDARIIDFKGFRDEIKELKKNGPDYPFILIGTYSGLRPPKDSRESLNQPPEDKPSEYPKAELLRELRFWDEDYPPLDMVIFDEAHYMRNQATTTFHLGENISASARAVLCVSATPVNNSNIDLHSLLRLIDEDFFATQASFEDLVAMNRPAVHAGNALAQAPVDVETLMTSVQGMAKSRYIKENRLFDQFIKHLESLSHSGFKDVSLLAKCQDIAEKLNLLGAYINRTRRVQVKEERAVRKPHVVALEYTPEEMELYQAILKVVRLRCKKNKKPFHVFQVMGLQLMTASCLPAFSHRILSDELFADENLHQEAFGGEGFEKSSAASISGEDISRIRQLLSYDFEKNDSKFKALVDVLRKEPKEKIIIFAYYRPTLAYLRRRLVALGESVTIIHGGIPIENRWEELDRFKDPNGPRILLASEVGSEGIDLQFCRILVNYDLPWNPMRVEQRIGRIDRVGQKAKSLSIVHFKVSNTIEERIHERLHEKLEAFSSSLGDLDDVIGEEVKQLTIDLLSNELTPEEERNKISQTQTAIENRLVLIKTLEESGDALVALSDYVQKKVEEDRGKGRFVQADELENYVADFFGRYFKGTEVNYNTPFPGCLLIRFSEEARASLGDFIQGDRSLSARPLRQKELALSFSREVLQRLSQKQKRNINFVNHLSPMIRWITKINKDKEHDLYKLAAVTVLKASIPNGVYLYRIERWVMKGLSSVEKLSYAMICLKTGALYSINETEKIFQEVLTSGDDWPYRDYDRDLMMMRFDSLESYMQKMFSEEVTQFEIENESVLQIKTQRVTGIFDRRIEQDKRRLQTLVESGREERVIRMAQGRLNKAQENKAKRLNSLRASAEILPDTEPVAVGLVQVGA